MRTWVMGLIPLILLAVLVAAFLVFDPTGFLRAGFPPVEELTLQRVTLSTEPREMVVHVIR